MVLGIYNFDNNTWLLISMFCTFTLHDLTRLFGDNINITCPKAQVWVGISKILFLLLLPPIDIHLIFEKSSLKHQVGWTWFFVYLELKVHTFWEDHKILRNLYQLFVLCTASQIIGGNFAKFCGLLRIYEL